MAGLFSGRAANALNAGMVNYAASMAAAGQVSDRLDAADRRFADASVPVSAGVAPRLFSAPVGGGMPDPLTTTKNLDPYRIGTTYTPAGVAVPAGVATPAPSGQNTNPLPTPAAPAAVDTDVENLTKEQWDAMSPAAQKVMLDKVNRQIEIANTRNAVGDAVSGVVPALIGDSAIELGKRAANIGIYGLEATGADKLLGMDAPPTPLTLGNRPIRDWLRSLRGKGGEPITAAQLRQGLANKPVSPAAREPQQLAAKPVSAATSKVAQAMQTPDGAMIVEYARAVGLNPAVAMATYGVESSFGTNKNVKSYAAAKAQGNGGIYGILQTRVASIFGDGGKERGVLAHFSDPSVLAKYPQEANNLAALVQMVQADPDSKSGQIAAGILRMKYSQDIGVPESLMGAAYQTSAEEVLRASSPTGASDGGLSNSDYNTRWQGELTAAQAALGGTEGIITPAGGAPAQPAAPQAQAGLATTGDKSFDSRVKFVMKKAPAEYDFQTQQLMQSRERSINLIQQREQAFAFEQQRIDAAYEHANQRLRAHQSRGDSLGMQSAMDELSAAQALAADAQERSYNFAIESQGVVDKYNTQLLVSESDRAVRELASGDPRRASALLSSAGGSQVIFQPRSDGGYVKVGPDGGYVLDYPGGPATKFTTEEVAKEVWDVADKAKAAAVDAGLASDQSKTRESELKINEAKVDIAGKIAEIVAKSYEDFKYKMQELDATVQSVTKDDLGNVVIAYHGPSGKVVTLSADTMQAVLSGDEIPTTSIKVKFTGGAGLNTEGAP